MVVAEPGEQPGQGRDRRDVVAVARLETWIMDQSCVNQCPAPHLAGAPPLVAAHPLAAVAALVLGPDAPGLEVVFRIVAPLPPVRVVVTQGCGLPSLPGPDPSRGGGG